MNPPPVGYETLTLISLNWPRAAVMANAPLRSFPDPSISTLAVKSELVIESMSNTAPSAS